MRKKLIALAALALILAGGFLVYLRGNPAGAALVPEIRLYTGENFTGEELVITTSTYDLPGISLGPNDAFYFNDEIRSVRVVRGTWRLYQHGRCNTKLDGVDLAEFNVRTKQAAEGWSVVVSALSSGELGFPTCASGGFGGDISSVELVSEENLPDWAMSLRH